MNYPMSVHVKKGLFHRHIWSAGKSKFLPHQSPDSSTVGGGAGLHSCTPHLLFSFSPYRFDFLLWCLCGACHTPTPQQRRLLLASSSVSSVSKSSRAATLPVPALTPTRSPAPLTWWRWPSLRPSRLTCHLVTAPTAASTAGHTWPTTTSSSQSHFKAVKEEPICLIQWWMSVAGQRRSGYSSQVYMLWLISTVKTVKPPWAGNM